MLNFVKIFLALLTGGLVVDLTVNIEKFPFHARWHQQRSVVRLESQRIGSRKLRSLWTEQGIIPYNLSIPRLFKLVALLAFKGTLENFYGGISMKAVTPAQKMNVVNAILTWFGYVTLNVDEHKTLRSVMKMLKDKNDGLKKQVACHEELLTSFSVQHQNLTKEVHDVRGQLNQTQEQLGDTRTQLSDTQEQLGQTQNQLSDTRAQLSQTQQQVSKLESQTDALCAALGIQSVDEFLQSVMPNQIGSANSSIQPLIHANDLKKLPHFD